jgi:hypothetical protein
MSDGLEKRLIEALKSVDAHGDVAPAHVHDPMTMLLRENAIQANLMRWDDVRGRYVLTGTGRRRTVEGSRAPGTVVSFRKRGIVGSGPLRRKSANDLSFEGERLSREFPVLRGVPVALRRSATSPVHATDAIPRTAGALIPSFRWRPAPWCTTGPTMALPPSCTVTRSTRRNLLALAAMAIQP